MGDGVALLPLFYKHYRTIHDHRYPDEVANVPESELTRDHRKLFKRLLYAAIYQSYDLSRFLFTIFLRPLEKPRLITLCLRREPDVFLEYWIFSFCFASSFFSIGEYFSWFEGLYVAFRMFRGEKAKGRISNDVTFQAAPPPTGGGPLKQVEERRCNDAPINALAAKLPN